MGIQFYYIRWFVMLCLASSLAVSGLGAGRSVRVGDVIIPRGQTNCFSIVLEREGNENAVGFGLCFDPNLLTFVSATNVGVASGASLNVNRFSVAQGRLGLALALPTGIAFEPGASDILQVCFRANDGAGIVTTPVTICDQPIRRELVDTNASVLPTTYTNAAATLVGTCAYSLATNRVSLAAAEGAGTIVVLGVKFGLAATA